MKPKMYSILNSAISHGIESGWDRGHKHSHDPSEHHLKTMIEQEIWSRIHKVFEFSEGLERGK